MTAAGVIGPGLIGRELTPMEWVWEPRDVILYALGIGAAPPRDLALVYEGAGPVVPPAFATVVTGTGFLGMVDELGLELSRVLHGDQSVTLHRPLPARGRASVKRRISEVWDKGAGAVIVVEEEVSDDAPLCTLRSSWFVSGAGGFGGERGPGASALPQPPDRAPDACSTRIVRPDLAALHRLSGDLNPVHIDPEAARAAGFEDTFLHGLCTFGIVALEALMEVCAGRPDTTVEVSGRFASRVMSGDELVVDLWELEDGTIHTRATAGDRPVLTGGLVRRRD